MEDVTRKRIVRQLESLPEEQLYQVMDYIEFLSAKYAAAAARPPDAFQRFAERVEDQMRVRSLAPKAMKGTMKIMSTAGKVLDGVRDLGKDFAPQAGKPAAAGRSGAASRSGAVSRAGVANTAGAKNSAAEVDGAGPVGATGNGVDRPAPNDSGAEPGRPSPAQTSGDKPQPDEKESS